jgi:hypothetical protein
LQCWSRPSPRDFPAISEADKRRILEKLAQGGTMSQKWRAAMASTAVSYVDGSRSWSSASANVRHGAD